MLRLSLPHLFFFIFISPLLLLLNFLIFLFLFQTSLTIVALRLMRVLSRIWRWILLFLLLFILSLQVQVTIIFGSLFYITNNIICFWYFFEFFLFSNENWNNENNKFDYSLHDLRSSLQNQDDAFWLICETLFLFALKLHSFPNLKQHNNLSLLWRIF